MLALSHLSLSVVLLAQHSPIASATIYDDFTTYNASVWDYADQMMGTTVRGCALLRALGVLSILCTILSHCGLTS